MSSNTSSAVIPAPGARPVDVRHPKYQEIKAKVHQDLLNRLNLERLTRVRREDAEPEIRSLILGLLEKESQATPLCLFEREALLDGRRLDAGRVLGLWGRHTMLCLSGRAGFRALAIFRQQRHACGTHTIQSHARVAFMYAGRERLARTLRRVL